MDVLLVRLQASGDPEAVNGDIDQCDQGGDAPFDVRHLLLVNDQDGDSVDDDLEEELGLSWY